MKTFQEYIIDWWRDYLDKHESDWKRIMESLIGDEETIEDYLKDGQSIEDWLKDEGTVAEQLHLLYNVSGETNAEDIYQFLTGDEHGLDNIPSAEDFIVDMLLQAIPSEWGFSKALVSDMSYHITDYTSPITFFKDLQHGGCASGMIGMFIYNTDCKKFYIEHIDDMENFVEELEDNLGESIRNKNHLPHYTFVCWLCYEELAYQIASNLFPDTF